MNKKTVRAKFVCGYIEDFGNSKTFNLSAVASGSEENKAFSSLTPSGNLSINITNDAPASKHFVSGKEYYLDFTEVETEGGEELPEANAEGTNEGSGE